MGAHDRVLLPIESVEYIGAILTLMIEEKEKNDDDDGKWNICSKKKRWLTSIVFSHYFNYIDEHSCRS